MMQVYVEKKLMGHLNTHVTGRHLDIRLAPELPPISLGPLDSTEAVTPMVYKTIRLTVEWASFTVSNTDITLMGADLFEESLRRRNVPVDAERIVEHYSDTVRFRWKILTCPEEHFEEVFELANFEPV